MSSDYKARNHKLRVQRILEMYKEQIDLDKIEDNFEAQESILEINTDQKGQPNANKIPKKKKPQDPLHI